MLPFLKKTLLSNSSASNRNFLSKSTKETEGGASLVVHGKESTCQCRKHGFHLWSRKIPHASEQLNPCAMNVSLSSRVQELQLLMPEHLEPVLCNKMPPLWKPTHRNWCSPGSLQLERAHAQQQRPSQTKNKYILKRERESQKECYNQEKKSEEVGNGETEEHPELRKWSEMRQQLVQE